MNRPIRGSRRILAWSASGRPPLRLVAGDIERVYPGIGIGEPASRFGKRHPGAKPVRTVAGAAAARASSRASASCASQSGTSRAARAPAGSQPAGPWAGSALSRSRAATSSAPTRGLFRPAEHLEMPHYLTGESLRSGSSIRTIRCMASAFPPAVDALEEDRRRSSSGYRTAGSAQSLGRPRLLRRLPTMWRGVRVVRRTFQCACFCLWRITSMPCSAPEMRISKAAADETSISRN